MAETLLRIETTRFGPIEVQREELIHFPEGLIGFGQFKDYVILEHPGGGPFMWLQAVEAAHLAFVICDPLLFKPDYKVSVKKEDLDSIHIEEIGDGVVVVILVVPRNPKEITANLQGPLVINHVERLGKQLVLTGPEYTTKYQVFQDKAGTVPEASQDAPGGPADEGRAG